MQTRSVRSFTLLLILMSLLFVFLMLFGVPQLLNASGQTTLFETVEEGHSAEIQSERILRSRSVTTNIEQVTLSNMRNRSPLRLNLFEDATLLATPLDINYQANDQMLWRGTVEGAKSSSVLFSVHNGLLAGWIEADGKQYQVKSRPDGTYLIQEIDPNGAWAESPPIPIDLPASPPPNRAVNDDGTTIDILVAYTDGARQYYGSTSAAIAAINIGIAKSNQVYQNSHVNTQLNLVHTVEVNYNASSNMSNDLSRLQKTNDGVMDSLHTLRDNYKADLVHLIVEEDDHRYCGKAYLMSNLSAGFADWAFGVTRADCVTDSYTLVHEVGHNMGSEHDPSHAQGDPLTDYSYGHWEPSYHWRTVMAYNCPSSCPVVGHLSNPNVDYNGAPTGINHAEDNARSISSALHTLANFRVSGPTAPPPSTGTISVRVASSSDDVEERNSDGNINTTSSDLELVDDSSLRGEQTVGVRFQGIAIPQGATINTAYLEFATDEGDSVTTNLIIHGENVDSAAPFVDSAYNVSGRTQTAASVGWSVGTWSTIGKKRQSPDIAAIVQQLVNRGGWQSGGSMAFIITGSGERTAESYDGDSAAAPLLVIEYESFTPTATPTPASTPGGPTPTPSINDTLEFAIIGDYGTDDSREAAVATLVASWSPTFITTAGDNVYGSHTFDEAVGKYYCEFVKDVTPDDSPAVCNGGNSSVNRFFPSPGNHDYDDGPTNDLSDYTNYFNLPGADVISTNSSGSELYYDVSNGAVHLFILDSESISNAGGVGSSPYNAQRAWLQTQASASTAAWQIVIMHHPPYSSSNHGSNSWMQWPYASWGVDAVIGGHDHVYERIMRDGIPYFVNGMGGRTFYGFGSPVTGSTVRYNSANGAMRSFASTSGLTFEFINVNGDVIDRHEVGVVAPTPTPDPQGTPLPESGIVEVRVANGSDDVEEREIDGVMYETSSDLEIGDDPGYWGDQEVGLRFQNLAIPVNATIEAAYLEFVVEAADSETTNVQIRGHSADSAPTFSSSAYGLTSRFTTAASVDWSIHAWNNIGVTQQSPDISPIIQEIVSRAGWYPLNDMSFIIAGTGQRSAEAYEGNPALAPLLHIEYTTGSDPVPTPTFTPQPTFTPSPTPTPVPADAQLVINDYYVGTGNLVTVTLDAIDIPLPGIGAATIDIIYDPSVLSVVGCSADPNSVFDIRICNPNAASNKISIGVTESNGAGTVGDVILGQIVFQAIGNANDASDLTIAVTTFADVGSNPLATTLDHGSVQLNEIGDVNCSGARDIIDALQIMQTIVGIRTMHDSCTLPENTIYEPLCDVNADTLCDITDALLIVQCAVNIPNSLCPARQPVAAQAPSNVATQITLATQPLKVGQTLVAPITAAVPISDSLFSGTIALYYDPSIVEISDCAIDNALMGACNVAFDNDGIAPDVVMFTLVSPSGNNGTFPLAEITMRGQASGDSTITLDVQALRNASGQELLVDAPSTSVTVEAAVSRVQLRDSGVGFGRTQAIWLTLILVLVSVGVGRRYRQTN